MRILLCVLSLFVMSGCSKLADSEMNASAVTADEPMVEQVALSEPSESQPVPERKLIRNGSMSIEVSDAREAHKQVQLLADECGGYLGSIKQANYNDRPSYNVVVRIPGNKLDEFITKVEKLAIEVESTDISVEDVSEEYVDLESRLVAKRQVEARFLEIVKQAKTVKETLEVESEIGTVRAAIEQIQGRMKYINSRVSFSTLELNYYEPASMVEPGTSGRFVASFVGGWNALVTFLVALTAAWPFLLMITTAIWFYVRRKKKETKVAVQA